MKNLLTLFIISAISFSTFGQTEIKTEMKTVGMHIYMGDLPITIADATDMSMAASPSAYMFFSRAKKMSGWNFFRGVAGAYEVIAGGANLGAGYAIGLVDLGLGGAMIASIVPRETKRTQRIIMGVKAYNKAIAE